jgi:hypothetical protein
MRWFRNIYNVAFFGFLVSVFLLFLYVRPLNSPWDRIINGDGLGYYSYLPAKYIYGDVNYEFKWFNQVYKANYAPGTFSNPEDNLLVPYGNRKINKYYPGLSYIWLPFFVMAHGCAKSFGYPPDGFSLPYQWFIALASLFYLFLGLIFLRKLLQKLFHNPFVYTLVPIAIFYGSHLYFYAFRFNSLSHSYSFTFLTLFVYFLVSYFNEKDHRLRNLLFCLLWLVISVCIRPLNGLVVLLIPAFFPNGFFRERLRFEKIKAPDLLLLLLTAGAIGYQLSITYAQTNHLIPYTYTDERFYFQRSIFFDALISYRIGLFVYAPLLFVSLFGIPWLPSRKRIILPVFFFCILFLYSSWWYWPIVKRAMVDYYFIPAIFLGALLNQFNRLRGRIAIVALLALTILFYQFKNFQVGRGILDEFSTYKEVFWRNFFRVRKANMFLVPPSSIKKNAVAVQDFESAGFEGNRTNENKHSGEYSLLLDSAHYISKISEQALPGFFNQAGHKKVRTAFWCYFEKPVKQLHLFIQFVGKDDKTVLEVPFYLDEESLAGGAWDYKEFGLDLADQPAVTGDSVKKVIFTLWNVEGKYKVYIDDVKTEFLLTDDSYEPVK